MKVGDKVKLPKLADIIKLKTSENIGEPGFYIDRLFIPEEMYEDMGTTVEVTVVFDNNDNFQYVGKNGYWGFRKDLIVSNKWEINYIGRENEESKNNLEIPKSIYGEPVSTRYSPYRLY